MGCDSIRFLLPKGSDSSRTKGSPCIPRRPRPRMSFLLACSVRRPAWSGRKGTNGVGTNGVTANCMLLTEGLFGYSRQPTYPISFVRNQRMQLRGSRFSRSSTGRAPESAGEARGHPTSSGAASGHCALLVGAPLAYSGLLRTTDSKQQANAAPKE